MLRSSSVHGRNVLPFGLARVRILDKMLLAMAPLMGLPEGVRIQLAIACDDLNVLKRVTMEANTVSACADAGVLEEGWAGRLMRLSTSNLPTQFSDLGVVSLKGRSYSPMAPYAVDFLALLGLQQATPSRE